VIALPGLVIGTRHLHYTQFNPDTGEVRFAGEPLPRLAWQLSGGGKDGLLVFLAALAVLLS